MDKLRQVPLIDIKNWCKENQLLHSECTSITLGFETTNLFELLLKHSNRNQQQRTVISTLKSYCIIM